MDFFGIDLNVGWTKLEGYPDGIEERVLADSLDERAGKGHRTRLLRFSPGAFTTQPFSHSYWEEVLLVEGDMAVADSDGAVHKFTPLTYACRPPNTPHGPFRSTGGCLLYEVHYFN